MRQSSVFPGVRLAIFAWLALPGLAMAEAYRPLLPGDFPDPFLLAARGRYLAYATNPPGGRVNIQMAESRDLLRWRPMRNGPALRDALPVLPAWAVPGFTWAPAVARFGTTHVLYFTARERASGLQCVGAAVAQQPTGPFVAEDPAPIACQRDLGGSIDPDIFRDKGGRPILYFKNDGNNPVARRPVQLYGQLLSPNGRRAIGAPVPILGVDQLWEGQLIEAPTMVRRRGRYILFFSANDYRWTQAGPLLSAYAVGYALCRTALGPCTAGADNPILASRTGARDCLSGPGHQAILRVGRRDLIAFHAWATTPACGKGAAARLLRIATLNWAGGRPVVGQDLGRRPARTGP